MPWAVVTGASGKLGRVFACALAAHGYSLILHCHRNTKAVSELCAELAAMGCAAQWLQADLTQPEERAAFIRESFTADTSVLINSAACFFKGNMAAASAEELARVFALNTFAPYDLITNFARVCAPDSLAINILDTKIFHDASGYAAYSLSKKSLADITRMAAREFAPGLRVHALALACVSPTEDASAAELSARAPLGHAGREEDIVYALDFFLQAGGVTGQCLSIDGGLVTSYFSLPSSADTGRIPP